MKKMLFIVLAVLCTLPVFADNEKLRVAVFDPTSSSASVDEGTKVAIREIISSTIVNAGNYDIVERSLLEKVMQEQSFSNSGAVNDSDATEIGKLAGANKVVLSVAAAVSGRNMLSIKLIDVKTASVDRQVVDVLNDVFSDVRQMTYNLLNANEPPKIEAADNSEEIYSPAANEIVLYLPPYTASQDVKFMKGVDESVAIYLDDEFIGSGTFAKGFMFKINKSDIKRGKKGLNNLKVGKLSLKIDPEKYNYYRFETTSKMGGVLGGNTVANKSSNNVSRNNGILSKIGSMFGGGNTTINQQQEIIYTLKIVLAEQKLVVGGEFD